MSFENPIWLYLAPAAALGAGALIAFGLRQRTQLLQKFAAERLLPSLTEKAPLRRTFIKAALVILGVALLGIALARPQYGVKWSEQKARSLDLVFALDSSKSMLASDIRPTRLDRAKLAIRDLMERLESDRVGLVAFAGQAFLQTPPTLDYSAFRESLEATSPSVLSRGGSDIGRALGEAAKAFPAESNVKVIVLLTDGEDLGGQAIEAARKASDNGIQVFTIGIGTPEGTYLRVTGPEGKDEFVRDSEGQPVRSQLDEAALQEIAAITGGVYSRLSGGELDQLYESVLATLPREERESELKEVKVERFQWFLSATILLLILESLIRRRGKQIQAISTITCLLLITLPDTASAEEQAAHAQDQLGYQALSEGDFAKAVEHYESSIRESDDLARQRDALYNMGHAKNQIARQTYATGDLESALEQIVEAEEYFDSARELATGESSFEEEIAATRAVKEAIEKLLEQQQEQENQDSREAEKSDESQEDQESSNENEPGAPTEDQGGKEDEQSESSEGQEGSEQNESESEEADDSQGSEGEGEESEPESVEGEQDEPSDQEQGGQDDESGEYERSEQPQSATEPEGEAGEQSQQPSPKEVPEVSEDGYDEDALSGSEAVPIEGMTIEQAQDLLDSLREREEILPFNRAIPGQGSPLQDW